MRPVSTEFLAAVAGSHTMVARAVLVDAAPQFGTEPTGQDLPTLAGDVSMSARSDIKSTLSLTVPGEWWPLVQPYGNEIYAERGVRLANGTIEYAHLGYHRIEQAEQRDAPGGPIELTCLDRIAQLQQNKLVFPLPVNEGVSHRVLFDRVINGGEGPPFENAVYATFGAYSRPIPIVWTAYNPDTATIVGDQIIADDSYEFLAKLAAERDAVLRFNGLGELVIESILVNAATAVATLAGGAGGTRIKVSRTASRRGVYNIVTAYGTDPSHMTGFVVAFNSDPTSPLAYNRTEHPAFGPAPRYYDSPLLQDDAAVEAASARLLDRYTGLPEPLTIECVPNPAIEPNDVIDVPLGSTTIRCVVDSIVLPLVADRSMKIVTRHLNNLEGVDIDLGT